MVWGGALSRSAVGSCRVFRFASLTLFGCVMIWRARNLLKKCNADVAAFHIMEPYFSIETLAFWWLLLSSWLCSLMFFPTVSFKPKYSTVQYLTVTWWKNAFQVLVDSYDFVRSLKDRSVLENAVSFPKGRFFNHVADCAHTWWEMTSKMEYAYLINAYSILIWMCSVGGSIRGYSRPLQWCIRNVPLDYDGRDVNLYDALDR